MMLPLLLLLAADPETAVEAERAFNRAAQVEGQWTAFRRTATADAVMFLPQETNAQKFLEPLENPPIAVQWWPTDSYVSCDGTAAVNSGSWVRSGSVGYFTTAWKRQEDGGWKWTLDHADVLPAARPTPEQPRVRRASCRFQRSANPAFATMAAPERPGHGKSRDGTLMWDWKVEADGARSVTVWLWNGRALDRVLHDAVAAPAK